MARLDDICAINMGQSPDSASYNENGEGMPFFQGNADFGKIHPKVRVWCSAPTKIAHAGDVLISVRAPIGALNIADRECCIGRGLAALTVNEGLCVKDYLWYAIASKVDELNSKGTGSTFKAISKGVLAETEIPLPDLNEQKKVAEQLTKVDGLIAARKEQLAKLDQLVKSRFIELFGAINDDVPLSYYIASLNAGKSLAGEEECPNKVLKTGAATYDYFDATQVKNLPLDYEPQEDHRVSAGDVIISRMNTAELVGAAAYVWDVPERVYLPDRLWRAEIKDTANAIFVWQVLIQSSTKESIRRIASGTSGSMKNISKLGLLGIRVVKAPISLQEQFAAFVEQTDKSKLAIQQSLDKLETLKKSLMQEYFG